MPLSINNCSITTLYVIHICHRRCIDQDVIISLLQFDHQLRKCFAIQKFCSSGHKRSRPYFHNLFHIKYRAPVPVRLNYWDSPFTSLSTRYLCTRTDFQDIRIQKHRLLTGHTHFLCGLEDNITLSLIRKQLVTRIVLIIAPANWIILFSAFLTPHKGKEMVQVARIPHRSHQA